MMSSIVVVGVLTHCALLHAVCNLKAAQMNVYRGLIRERYEFERGFKQPKTFVLQKMKI